MKPQTKDKGSEASSSHQHWVFPGKLENEGIVLHSMLPKYPISYYDKCVSDIKDLITRLVRNHGYTDGSQRYKVVVNYVILLIEGREPENPGWLATSEVHAVPSCLGRKTIALIVDYLNSTDSPQRDDKYYQVILTLLSISRKVKGLVDTDYKSITDKATPIDPELLSRFETFVSKKLSKHKYIPTEVNLSRYNTSIKKKGPNGLPKVESAHAEAIELMTGKLSKPFRNVCSYFGCNYLVDYLDQLSEVPFESPIDGPIRLRVLVPISDSGFKTRVVAIADFWTQLILEPFREEIIRTTNQLYGQTDYRLNQEAGVADMVELQQLCIAGETIGGHKMDITNLGFLDASDWTNRFHRDLQKIVVKHKFSPYLAEHWAQLTVHCDWYAPELGRTIKYGQGQGMGTNGSFDIATLTDHLFMDMIRQEDSVLRAIQHERKKIYGKVGDDLFTYGYQKILEAYQQIHLPINLSKSKVPCKLGSVAEFCARTVINGMDVSRVSPSIIQKSRDFRYLPLLLNVCASRGVDIKASLFPNLLNEVKSDPGVTYLEKLQPYILSLHLLGEAEPGSVASRLTISKLEEQGWLLPGIHKDILDTPHLRITVLLATSVVNMSVTMGDLQDKIFEVVEGMEFYGDDIVQFSIKSANLFDPNSEISEYLRTGPFTGQRVATPRQIVVLGRYLRHRSLIRDQFDELCSTVPESPEALLRMVKEISRITHSSCYDGGNLNYDTDKMFNIQFAMAKVLDRLDLQENILTLPDNGNIRSVLTAVNYDEIARRWSTELPKLNLEQ